MNMRGYIPFQVMATYFPIKEENHANAISYIEYQPRVVNEHLLARSEVQQIVARNHGLDASDDNAFEGWDTIQSSKAIGAIFDAMNMFLGAVGLVTLALGAIGVINIMLVTVSERTREIGLRKALGATNRSILFQFFLEGLLLTLGSGSDRHGTGRWINGTDGNRAGTGGIRSSEAGAELGHPGDWLPDAGRRSRGSLSRAQSGYAATCGSAASGVEVRSWLDVSRLCFRNPTARCGTTAVALRSPCSAWPGASRQSSCCSLTATVSDKPAQPSSRTSAPS